MKTDAVMFKGMLAIASAMTLFFLFSSCEKEVFDPALTHEFAMQLTASLITNLMQWNPRKQLSLTLLRIPPLILII